MHRALTNSNQFSQYVYFKMVQKLEIVWIKGLDNLADLDVTPIGTSI